MSINVIVKTNGDFTYKDVFLGNLHNVDTLSVPQNGLTTDFVDTYGWLKPGTPFQASGAPITGAGQAVYGVTPSAQTLIGRTDNSNLGADANTTMVAVGVTGAVSKKAIEFNLGRALSANEIAAFAAAGCKIQLVY